MGPAAKRRAGGSSGNDSGGAVGGGSSSSRKSPGGGGRVKIKIKVKDKYKEGDGEGRSRDDDDGGGGRSRGGARSRLLARADGGGRGGSSSRADRSGGTASANNNAPSDPHASPAAAPPRHPKRRGVGSSRSRKNAPDSGDAGDRDPSSSSKHHRSPAAPPPPPTVTPSHPAPLDPTLLARGMSARSVGARISSRVRPVSLPDVEKDLRHMEAYGAACTAYAQQFFAYVNRDLVSRGHYGPVPLGPGLVGAAGVVMANGAAPSPDGKGGPIKAGSHYDAVTGCYVTPQSQASQKRAVGAVVGVAGPVSMPVRIDPEEEKRLALLRKRVAASEAKREVLETEYLSLRAHYWYENQKLRKTRRLAKGQLELLRELVKRRGRVVSLRRVRCAMARDVMACLEHRKSKAGRGAEKKKKRNEAMVGVEPTGSKTPDKQKQKAAKNGKERKDKDGPASKSTVAFTSDTPDSVLRAQDLLAMWTAVEEQLAEAERACSTIPTPADLVAAKETPGDTVVPPPPTKTAAEATSSDKKEKKERRSKSPTRGKAKDDDGDAKENGKARSKKGDKGGDDGKDKESKRGKVVTSADDDGDDNVVPWNSQHIPRTPNGVPILLSFLSSAPDRGAGFASGGLMGSCKDQITYLQSNLPVTYDRPEYLAPYAEGHEELLRLREEVAYLEEELDLEKGNNRELQRQIINGRKRSDGVCATMGMLRTETDAVMNRHNAILDTTEAKDLAVEYHQRVLREQAEAAAAEAEDDELDELEEEGDDLMPREVGAARGGGGGFRGDVADDELSVGEGLGGATPVDDIGEESDFDLSSRENPVKEVIVPISGAHGGYGAGKSDDSDEEGEIDEEEDGEIKDEEKLAGGMKRTVEEGEDDGGIENTSKRRKLEV